MYFDSFSAMLAMGGHGVYVWSAYLVTALVMVWLVVSPLRAAQRIKRELRAHWRREGGPPTGSSGVEGQS